MGLQFNRLLQALMAGGVFTPPPAPVTYGATADAGEIDNATSITGTRYWFSYSTGSDSNPGTNSGSPAKTLVKMFDYTASGGSLTAPRGSGFMMARGDTWDGFFNLNNNDGTFFGNYLIGATGTGARPLISYKQSASLVNANIWGAFCNQPSARVQNVKLDIQNSFTATAGSIVGTFADGDVITGGTSGATGVFTYNNAGVFQLRLTSTNMFTSGETITAPVGKSATISSFNHAGGIKFGSTTQSAINVEVSNAGGNGVLFTPGIPNNAIVSNSTIRDCCRRQAAGGGIGGGGVSGGASVTGLTITNNTLIDCGNGNQSHNMYVDDFNNSTISGNWSYMTMGTRGNHALVIHGACSTVTIEDNLFEACNNGVGINDGYASAEYFDLFTIRNNINRNHGYSLGVGGLGQGQAWELACITNSAIYNNISYNCDGLYSLASKRSSGGADVISHDVTISHETIYNIRNGLANTSGGLKIFNGAVTNIIVQNCIFATTYSAGLLLEVDAAAAAGVTLRNCIFYAPSHAGNVISWSGTLYTIAGFLAGPGAGKGHVNADPLFVNAATGDFRLQAGSPCKLAGYNSGITTDFAGNARHATTPSIGAYE